MKAESDHAWLRNCTWFHQGDASNHFICIQIMQAAQLAEELQHAKAGIALPKAVVRSSRRRAAGMCQRMCHVQIGWSFQ